MKNNEHNYIKLCISIIEEKLGWAESSYWKQRDYLSLIEFFENKTGVTLSLSTIKRIWKPDYKGIPHPSTLDVFASFLDYDNWQDFKEKNKQNISEREKLFSKNRIIKDDRNRYRKRLWKILVISSAICVSCTLVLLLVTYIKLNNVSYNENDVIFSCKKSNYGRIPNSVIFTYNVKSVKAEKFYIQQDWDRKRRIEVQQENTIQTDIYYTPGFFNAKLIANDKVIKEIPVHITYENWFIGARQHPTEIITFEQEKWTTEDYLGVKKSALTDGKLDISKDFQFNIYNSKEFNVDGDNFEYVSSFKMDPIKPSTCPNLAILIKGENSLFWIPIGNKGCESNLNLNCSNSHFSGKTNDLSLFGVDIYSWQNINITVTNKNVLISINDSSTFECSYQKSMGSLKTINYYFNGLGQIDNVKLLDAKGNVKFADDFNK